MKFIIEFKDAFIDQQEWRLHEHVETSTKLLSSPFTPSQNQHPAFSATCKKLKILFNRNFILFRSCGSTTGIFLLECLFSNRKFILFFF